MKACQGTACTYQGPTTKQYHEDDESLEPVVLHNLETRLPEIPPFLPFFRLDVNVEAGAPLDTGCSG